MAVKSNLLNLMIVFAACCALTAVYYRSKAGGDRVITWFRPENRETNNFHLLLCEGSTALIGARNTVFNISLSDLKLLDSFEWKPPASAIADCQRRSKTEVECQNYIKVIVRTEANKILVCGTYAFKPQCRSYVQKSNGVYILVDGSETRGTAMSPSDFRDNSTAIYANGRLYTTTVSDFMAQDSLIMEHGSMIRTQERDSRWLNDPDFVSSFDIEDKIYFFFRESAVEHINCGKAVFSRVARICKKDTGGARLLTDTWTSFFKARLNCSVPGDYPFYFDEIQSTSTFGQGNFRPTLDSRDQSDMIYAVFSTPRNVFQASAVCTFRYSDIAKAFQGQFKGQESVKHNWLPVSIGQTPVPHPAKCANNSRSIKDTTLNFIKEHPLMDKVVPSAAGRPLLVHSTSKSQFTHIAIDWQVHAADNRFYDVMFIGTDDGRLIKAVNKAQTQDKPVETVEIEDIRVFSADTPVRGVRVVREPGVARVIVVADNELALLALHRCSQQHSCQACLALQDPYCSWSQRHCAQTDMGIMTFLEDEREKVCARQPMGGSEDTSSMNPQSSTPVQKPSPGVDWHFKVPERIRSRQQSDSRTPTEILIIAVVGAVVLCVLFSFFISSRSAAAVTAGAARASASHPGHGVSRGIRIHHHHESATQHGAHVPLHAEAVQD